MTTCCPSLSCVRRGLLLAVLLAGMGAVLAPVAASAAEGYRVGAFSKCTKRSGGQPDRNGTMYISCNSSTAARIWVKPRAGTATFASVAYPSGSTKWVIYDVAPSPTGAFLYVSAAVSIGGNRYRTPRRLKRTRAGTYMADTAWKVADIPYGQTSYMPQGPFIATDALGDIYWSNGQYPVGDTPSIVAKYRPDGSLITTIGDLAPGSPGDATSWTPGLFFKVPVGLAPTRDGSSLYVAETGNNRVQKFDLQPNGTYRHSTGWGNTQASDPTRVGSCAAQMFGIPYDVVTDPWGFVYVLNTSCERVHKYTASGGYLGAFKVDTDTIHQNHIAHSIGVDGNGNIFISEIETKLTRTTPVPTPFPAHPVRPTFDTTAPVLTAVNVPAPTAPSRTITVSLTASDVGAGLAKMRVTNDSDGHGHYFDIDEQPWVAYQQTWTHQLADTRDTQAVIVQLMDGAGNVSSVRMGVTRIA